MISRKRGDDIYIGVRPQKEIRKNRTQTGTKNWIVDPIRESAVIYRAAEDWIPMFYRFGDSLKAGIYEDLEIVIE